jgi:hypothetical protein
MGPRVVGVFAMVRTSYRQGETCLMTGFHNGRKKHIIDFLM